MQRGGRMGGHHNATVAIKQKKSLDIFVTLKLIFLIKKTPTATAKANEETEAVL